MGNTQSISSQTSTAGQSRYIQADGDDVGLVHVRSSSTIYRLRDPDPEPASPRVSTSFARSSLYASLRRRRSAHSTSTESDPINLRSLAEPVDEREERPLVSVVNTVDQDAVITAADLATASRSRSRLARLSSRLLPSSTRSPSTAEETVFESQPSGSAVSHNSRSLIAERQIPPDIYGRFSLSGSMRRRMHDRNPARPDLRRHTIRGPFPLSNTQHQLLNPGNIDRVDTEQLHMTSGNSVGVSTASRRHDRFSRMRNSLSAPFSVLFPQTDMRLSRSHSNRPLPHRTSRVTFADDSDHLLPPLSGLDHRLDIDDTPHELDAVEPETRNILSSPRVTSGMSTIRRFPHGLRSRSTRLIRRGEHPPLSQVLQLAAAAIAAQLSGHANTGTGSNRPLGGDAFDGSIQDFVQTLQDAASAQAGENIDVHAADGDLPPVNFMRVFQFPNDENGSPITSQAQSRDIDQMDIEQITNPGESGRSVTLVLVGVRSMPHGQDGFNSENGTLGPSLDTLLSLPFLPPANILRNGSSGALFHRSEGRSRAHNRRHSMTNFSFPAQYESQRHQRTRTPASRSSIEHPFLLSGTPNGPTPVSESPPGPHPPPSTPADIRSGHATPIRRPSSASAIHSSFLPDLEEDGAHGSASTVSLDAGPNVARQRRRSDSEFAQRPDLGSGASRRNGVVEPDHPPPNAGRSWLIYVVGTNVSPDHPAFTMPSLFTDNPSYEDMQMLSTLLGPVKPPVASREDVSSAGGIYELQLRGKLLTAVSTTDSSKTGIDVHVDERCLICLSEYVAADEVRQLDHCEHVFHRECIDEWLTTGRNSCPMCRGQGVCEKKSHHANASSQPVSEGEDA